MTAVTSKYKSKLTEEIVEAIQFIDQEEGETTAPLILEWATEKVRRLLKIESTEKLLIETPNGWTSILKGDYVVWDEEEQDFFALGHLMFESLHDEVKEPEEESPSVTHARRELESIGEDPDVIEWYLRVIKEYMSFGHSGGSHAAVLPVLFKLLNHENLGPLTDDPEEWYFHEPEQWDGENGVWQNKRNGEAFSNDGGKSYYLLSEGGRDRKFGNILHQSITK